MPPDLAMVQLRYVSALRVHRFVRDLRVNALFYRHFFYAPRRRTAEKLHSDSCTLVSSNRFDESRRTGINFQPTASSNWDKYGFHPSQAVAHLVVPKWVVTMFRNNRQEPHLNHMTAL